ncbi:Zn-ribbon domain-containing OB-fold protein [Sinorhizobium meliloti]|uniref:Zn-ribbon domain-containing OB-fold protein n=1 Tax=Rhizobium meliloti TaxID=382 RepID=UPI003D661034
MSVPTSAELEEFFFSNLAAGKLHIQECNSTGQAQWYPRAHSVQGRDGVTWKEASGRGTLFSFSVMHRGQAPETARLAPPIVVALVELSEGPLLAARIESEDPTNLYVGMELRLCVDADPTLLVFSPMEL